MTYKVNVKGVFDRASMTATAGCVMKKDGRWVRGLGGNIRLADPITAELWAIYYGLKMAWERAKINVVMFSECKEAITATENNDMEYPMAMLVDMIKMLLGEAWNYVDIQDTFKQANRGAYAMATHFLRADGGICEMSAPPSAIAHLV